jgi:hypothetical protein
MTRGFGNTHPNHPTRARSIAGAPDKGDLTWRF